MDSLTQAALGAAIGQATLGKYIGKKAMVLGAAVATLPDLDIVLYLFYDKFEMLSIHRGVSHSIIFSLVGSCLIGLLLKQLNWSKKIPLSKLWLFSLLALITHILLDAFTTYGTQLLLPFSDFRIGWDSINVVDPFYSFPLILGLAASYLYNKKFINTLGLIFSSIYLLGTLGIKGAVNERLKNDLLDENIEYISASSIPVGSASLNWYGVAKDKENLYLKKYSLFQKEKIDFHSFKINDNYLDKLSREQKDKMIWFAKGFYTAEMDKDTILIYNLQVDMRGVVKNDSIYRPTKGYFKFIPLQNGTYVFSSGAH